MHGTRQETPCELQRQRDGTDVLSMGTDQTGKTLFACTIETPLGEMVAIAGDQGLGLLEFADRRALKDQIATLQAISQSVVIEGDHDNLRQTKFELSEYFAGERRAFEIEIQLWGTEFQRQVWERLLEIPYGATRSYGDIAATLDQPNAVRAVGLANGLNRIAIVVPCHRVIGAGGKLTGYGGGLWRKQQLLELESGQRRLLS